MKFSERVRNHCIAAGHESPHQYYQAPCDDCIDAVRAADLQELLDLISDKVVILLSGGLDSKKRPFGGRSAQGYILDELPGGQVMPKTLGGKTLEEWQEIEEDREQVELDVKDLLRRQDSLASENYELVKERDLLKKENILLNGILDRMK